MNITKNIKFIAQDVLINKSCATEKRSQFFANDFGECVNEIYSSKGTVAITGIGKNAIIANKIMAPINPTVHISESSNSLEIKALVPLLKRKASKLVARVRNTNSLQEQKTDYKLNEVSLRSHFNYQILATSLNLGYASSVYLFQLTNVTSPVAYGLHMVPGIARNDDFQRRLNMGSSTDRVNALVRITKCLKSDYAHKSAVNQLDQMQENKFAQRVAMKNQNHVKPFIHTHYILMEGIA